MLVLMRTFGPLRINAVLLMYLGYRDCTGLPKECQYRAILQTTGLGGDQMLPGGHDQPGGQQTCPLPAPCPSQVRQPVNVSCTGTLVNSSIIN